MKGVASLLISASGFTGGAGFWELQIRAFSTSHRVVAMDPRSPGDSEKTYDGNFTERRAQDIRDVVDTLNRQSGSSEQCVAGGGTKVRGRDDDETYGRA
jgi:pimeloyl-ACP methyl ester carboxylesterase